MQVLDADLPEESGYDAGSSCDVVACGEEMFMYEGAHNSAKLRMQSRHTVNAESVAAKARRRAQHRRGDELSAHERAMRRLRAKAVKASKQQEGIGTSKFRAKRGTAGTCGGRRCPRDPQRREEFLEWKQLYKTIMAKQQLRVAHLRHLGC
jgi:hypothetical protein